jgi:hypothetical protein
MAVDYPDWLTEAQVAVSLSTTDLSATGLAKESGGHLASADAKVAQAGSTIAGDIAVTGTPALRKVSNLGNGNSVNVVGNATVTLLNSVSVNQLSVQLLLDPNGNSAATPFMQINFAWDDGTGTNLEPQDSFIIPCAQIPGNSVWIECPARSALLTLTVTNLAGTTTQLLTWSCNQTSHPLLAAKILETNPGAVNGFTRPANNPQLGLLGAISTSVAAATTFKRLVPAWFGAAMLTIDASATTAATVVSIADPQSLYSTIANAEFYAFTVPAGVRLGPFEVYLPAGPTILQVITPAGAAQTIAVTLVRKETYS